MAVKHILLFVLLGYAVVAEELATVPDTQSVVEEHKDADKENFLKKCEENGGPEASNKFDAAADSFKKCLTSLLDTTKLQKEIDEAKPLGKIDEVFKKYCDQKPQLTACFSDYMGFIKPCFAPVEQDKFNILTNITKQLANFACDKDGERIAMFIAEKGPECFQSKSAALRACVNNTFLEDFQQKFQTNPTAFNFGEGECGELKEIEQCCEKVLLGCPEPTSANIMGSMFKFLREATPCKQLMANPNEAQAGSATGLTVTMATIISSVTAIFLM